MEKCSYIVKELNILSNKIEEELFFIIKIDGIVDVKSVIN